jgi:hypothetical protein
MKLQRFFLAVSLILLVSGCAATKVTSFKDTERAASKNYTRIVILAPLTDLENRSAIEKAFVLKFNEKRVSATPSISIIPPTRSPSKEEIIAKVREGGYDGLLLVDLTDSYRDQKSTPGYATTFWGKRSILTTFSGGDVVSLPRTKFRIELLDIASQHNVWVSSTLTQGNAYAGAETMAQSLAQSTVKQLTVDGLIKDNTPALPTSVQEAAAENPK